MSRFSATLRKGHRTVKELAEKYETEILIMTGFLDGINESLAIRKTRLENNNNGKRIPRSRLRLTLRSNTIW